jgi:hypothetical protein
MTARAIERRIEAFVMACSEAEADRQIKRPTSIP